MTQLSIGVTGHRDIRPEEENHLRRQVRTFFESLQLRYPGQVMELYSALAEGADTMAAEIALDMGFSLVAVLPMPLAHCQEDFEAPGSLEKFQALLEKADQVFELPAKPGADLRDQDTRSWHYARMGVFISDHCRILLALWDGKDNNALGGTAQVVRYHLGSDMPGFTDSRPDGEPKTPKDNVLVFHIVTSRDRVGGEPLEGLHAGQEYWMGAD